MKLNRRLGALVAASALTVSGLALGASPAQAAADLRPQGQAADWLAGQLTGGLMHNPAYGGFDDYGLTIDTALALDAVGGHDAAVTAAGNAIRNRYYSYTTGADYGDPVVYAGGIAKALVLAQVAGTAPAGYRNAALTQLVGRVATDAPIAGRIQNKDETSFPSGDPADTANVFGQAFAVRALNVADDASAAATTSLAFLLQQQCADGGFREKLDAKDDASQGCDPGDTATYGDRIGATATAVLNLVPIAGDVDVADELADARDWLVDQQNDDGSFGSDGGNANSTGLAAQALGDSPEAAEAAAWLRAHQADDADACTRLAGDVGAVAFSDASLADGRDSGINDDTVGEWQRATSQSVVALGYLEAAPAANLAVAGPSGYVKGGTTASYRVTGAVAGSRLCMTAPANASGGAADGDGAATIALRLPGGTAARTVQVVDAGGSTATVVTRVLGATRLQVRASKVRVRRGGTVRVVVRGLAAGERAAIGVRGRIVRGTANANGVFVRVVRPGRKLGRTPIRVVGQFGDIRHGVTRIRVVR